MPDQQDSSFQLTERDRAILDHISCFGISTAKVLHHLYFGTREGNAVTKVTTRLRRAGYLEAHELYDKYLYFVLGPNADRPFKRGPSWLGTRRLIEAYSALMLCNMGERVLPLVPKSEKAGLLATLSLPESFPHHDFYTERSEGRTRLVLIRVDHGGERRRLLQKISRKVHGFMRCKGFPELVRAKQFAITLATTSERKRGRLQAHYARNPIEGIPLSVVKVDGLEELIRSQRKPRATPSSREDTDDHGAGDSR